MGSLTVIAAARINFEEASWWATLATRYMPLAAGRPPNSVLNIPGDPVATPKCPIVESYSERSQEAGSSLVTERPRLVPLIKADPERRPHVDASFSCEPGFEHNIASKTS